MATVKYSGPVASFHCPTEATIRSLKVHFSPKQLGSGTPSPENVREIVGWDEVEVYKTNQNLLIPSSIVLSDGTSGMGNYPVTYSVDGNTIIGYDSDGTVNQMGLTFKMWLQAGVTYKVTYGKVYAQFNDSPLTEVGLWLFRWMKDTQTFKAGIFTPEVSGYYLLNLGTYPSGKVYELRIEDIKITIDDSSYITPAYNNKISLDWFNDIGTIYGGYVDLVTGELVQNYEMITINSTQEWQMKLIQNHSAAQLNLSTLTENTKKTDTYGMFNYVKYMIDTSQLIDWNGRIANTGLMTIFIPSDINTRDDMNNYIAQHPLQVCYELATPITHQLTPIQLQTFLGQNNVWSNADYVEVEYDLHETQDILARKQFIIANQPHVETVIGSIVSFKTDMNAPLKQCKVHFVPIQAGNGIPAQNNVREITGWNNITVAQRGSNLYNYLKDENGYIYTDGSITNDGNYSKHSELIPVVEGVTYTFSGRRIKTRYEENKRVHGYDAYGNWLCQLNYYHFDANTEGEYIVSFTIPIGVKYIALSFAAKDTDRQLIIGTDILQPEVYWNIDNDLPFPTEIYGGYIDLINGELVETYKKYNLGDLSVVTYGAASYDGDNGTNAMYYITDTGTGIGYPNGIEPIGDKIVCAGKNISGYYIGTWSNPDDYIWKFCINANNQLHVVFDNMTVGITSDMTFAQRREKITEWLQSNPITVVVPRQTPIVHSLTPTQLKTLRGTNNIWSNANGNIELSYWKH